MEKNNINVGVVGYSGQKFNNQEASKLLQQAYEIVETEYPENDISIVSGLTDMGIPALAYRAGVEKGWSTVGIACSKARDYDCFPVDNEIIVGEDWGDESKTFIDSLDILVRIGGGNQSIKETIEAKSLGIKVIEYELEAE